MFGHSHKEASKERTWYQRVGLAVTNLVTWLQARIMEGLGGFELENLLIAGNLMSCCGNLEDNVEK